MIGYLSGSLRSAAEQKWLVWIGQTETVGVGYSVTVPARDVYQKVQLSNPVGLWIYTHVREDILDLFGFLTSLEKELFLTLLGISGVGPKVALALLGGLAPEELIEAIIVKDQQALCGISGVGKKTAERIVLELSESIGKKIKTFKAKQSFEATDGSLATSAGSGAEESGEADRFLISGVLEDSMMALQALGFRENDISIPLKKLLRSSDAPVSVEAVVKTFLKQRSAQR